MLVSFQLENVGKWTVLVVVSCFKDCIEHITGGYPSVIDNDNNEKRTSLSIAVLL